MIETGWILTQTWITCQDWWCHIFIRRVWKALISYLMRLSWESRAYCQVSCDGLGDQRKETLEFRWWWGREAGRWFLHSGRGLCGVKLPPVLKEGAPWGPHVGHKGQDFKVASCETSKTGVRHYYMTKMQLILAGPFTKCPLLVVEHRLNPSVVLQKRNHFLICLMTGSRENFCWRLFFIPHHLYHTTFTVQLFYLWVCVCTYI